jgi:hypothetical protein
MRSALKAALVVVLGMGGSAVPHRGQTITNQVKFHGDRLLATVPLVVSPSLPLPRI